MISGGLIAFSPRRAINCYFNANYKPAMPPKAAALTVMWLALLALAALLPRAASAARLVVVPLSSESHISAFTALTTELESLGGHEIHMVRCTSVPQLCSHKRQAPHTAQGSPASCLPTWQRQTTPFVSLLARRPPSIQVVSQELLEASKAMATARSPGHRHGFHTYPLRFDLFADDMAKMSKAGFITSVRHGIVYLLALCGDCIGDCGGPATTAQPSPGGADDLTPLPQKTTTAPTCTQMFYGYRILAALMESVLGDERLMGEIRDLDADLVVGDAVGSYGHWLSGLLGVPSVEFDVGTSSGLLHAGLWGGQLNPSYIPGPGAAWRGGAAGWRPLSSSSCSCRAQAHGAGGDAQGPHVRLACFATSHTHTTADCHPLPMLLPGRFYPSTGMNLPQRCINTAAIVLAKVINYCHHHFGPIGRWAGAAPCRRVLNRRGTTASLPHELNQSTVS